MDDPPQHRPVTSTARMEVAAHPSASDDLAHLASSAATREMAGVWHDLRSVFAAATTNLEYLRTQPGLPADIVTLVAEIENEVRFAAAIADFVGSERLAESVGEFDLRALLWLAGRGTRRLVLDLAAVPFLFRSTYAEASRLVDVVRVDLSEGARACLTNDDRQAKIVGLAAASVDALVELVRSGSFDVDAVGGDGTLLLTHER